MPDSLSMNESISKVLAIKNEGNKAYVEGIGCPKCNPLDLSSNCRTSLKVSKEEHAFLIVQVVKDHRMIAVNVC
jgi:hypothetical protein